MLTASQSTAWRAEYPCKVLSVATLTAYGAKLPSPVHQAIRSGRLITRHRSLLTGFLMAAGVIGRH